MWTIKSRLLMWTDGSIGQHCVVHKSRRYLETRLYHSLQKVSLYKLPKTCRQMGHHVRQCILTGRCCALCVARTIKPQRIVTGFCHRVMKHRLRRYKGNKWRLRALCGLGTAQKLRYISARLCYDISYVNLLPGSTKYCNSGKWQFVLPLHQTGGTPCSQ